MKDRGEGKKEKDGTSAAFASPGVFRALAVIVTLVSCLLQIGGVGHEAVIDDHGWLRDDVYRGCGDNAWECFAHPQLYYYYRPLVAVSFVWGLRLHPLAPFVAPGEARPFHLENLLLHGMAVLLVFQLLRLLIGTGLPALLGGLLFALHPLHVPVTTFIGGRTDTLALIFLALWAIGLIKSETAWAWRVLSLIAFGCALFTKEQSYLLLLLAPLLAAWQRRERPERPTWREWREGREWPRRAWLAWFAVPVGAHLWWWHRVGLTIHAEDLANHVPARSFFAASGWSPGLHLDMVGRTCWYYACCFLFPTVSRMHQSTLGPWDCAALGPQGCATPNVPHPPSPALALGGYVALAFALWLLWRLWPRPACRIGLLWTLVTLLPCLNILPVPSQFVAPYRALIPLVGVCLLAGALLQRLLQHGSGPDAPPDTRLPRLSGPLPLTLWTLLAGVCGGLAWATLADVPCWQSDGALMQAEMRADLNFVPARGGEAVLYDQNGQLEEAIAAYDKALHQLLPEAHSPDGQNKGQNKGPEKEQEKKQDKGQNQAQKATTDAIIRAGRAPDMPRRLASASSLRYNDVPYLARILLARGGLSQRLARWNDAAEDYRAARALSPQNTSIGDWLAYALDHAGRAREAESALLDQIARRPDAYRLSQLGSLYFRQKRWEAAHDMLGLALRAPASDTGANMDAVLTRQQYDQSARLLKH